MNINPNLRNPLSLFAICFLVVESIFTTLFMWRVESISLCPCMVKMLLAFIVIFPSVVFIAFFFLLLFKYNALFSPFENAEAERIERMNQQEEQCHQMEKNVKYGDPNNSLYETSNTTKQKALISTISEEEILDKYISLNAPFLQKNIKVETKNGPRYFDAYANWNGCHYVAEVKRLQKWTQAGLHGVRTFATNAKECFSSIQIILILKIESACSEEEVNQAVHKIDPAIKIVFVEEASNTIKFYNIY